MSEYTTHIHWARLKTSTTRTSSTANEDQPQHVIITIDSTECNIIMVNRHNDDTPIQIQPSTRRTNPAPPLASQAIGSNHQGKKRSYAGNITEIRIFPDHQFTTRPRNNRKPKGTTYQKGRRRHLGPHNKPMTLRAALIFT